MDYLSYFQSKFPEEAVGYIKDGVFHPVENIAEDRLHDCQFDGRILINEPDTIIHSHPRVGDDDSDLRIPSYIDMENQLLTAVEWGICVLNKHEQEAVVFWGNPKHRPSLMNREFIPNIQDCLSFVQDWYYQTLNITLPNIPRHPNWDHLGETYMDSLYKDWGFVEVPLNEMRFGDVMMFKCLSATTNHVAVYVGDGKMMHHSMNQVPLKENVSRMMKRLVRVVRHKEWL